MSDALLPRPALPMPALADSVICWIALIRVYKASITAGSETALALANLAFCSYLPDYNLNYGLLSYDVINQHFNEFISYFPEIDRDYYKSIFIDSYENKKLPSDIVYYSDYVIKQHQNSSNSNSSLAYIKATEAGRAFANQDEAAFGHSFFFLTIVASIIVVLVGFLIYFSSYLGEIN